MINRIRQIAENLTTEHNVDRAVQLIAINACTSGKSSRIFIGKFHKDLKLFNFANFGFDSRPGLITAFERSFAPKLMVNAIQANSVSIMNHDENYQSLFHDAIGSPDDAIWRNTILIPLLPNYFATLSIQVELTNEKDIIEYFNALRALISLFLNLGPHAGKVSRESQERENKTSRGAHLTERQELILELILEGKTNHLIATRMGYSESLIRQESIVIYRKLGIEGRKDLDIAGQIA